MKSVDAAKEEVREVVRSAMHMAGGSTLPIHVRLAQSAFDFAPLLGDQGLPEELFSSFWCNPLG